MELQGEIIKIGETETFGAKGFKKRQVVVKTNSQYPQTIPVDFTQDKCSVLDIYSIGDFVNIAINIQGSEWQGKYYVNLQGWKIDKGEKEMSSSSFMPDREATDDLATDDLPF